jgi:hypothetical protein
VKQFLLAFLLLSGWMSALYPADPPLADSTDLYYEDLTDLLSLKLFTLTKSNTLSVIHPPDGSVNLKPNGNTGLGLGFNYKFIGIALSFGVPSSQASIEKYGNTNDFDLQVSFFGRKIGFDGYLQGYKGYYMANPQDHVDWNESYYPQVSDLRILSIGANAFYLFNSKNFSYKAAYLRNVVQKKSAGSFSTGIYFYQDLVTSDNGFLPDEVSDSTWSSFDLKQFNSLSIGISAGYQYTFVIKENFFISLQATPGLGYRRLSGNTDDEDLGIVNQLAGQILARAAIGYEFKHFYVGAMASTIVRSFKYKDFEVDLGTEQFRVMIGKRFDVGRKKP